MIGDMIDTMKESLLDIRKNLEKSLIRTFVASQTYATSENRKRMLEQIKETKCEELKSNSSSYLSSFSTSAKGEWVNKAKKAFQESSKQFEQM